MLAQQPVIILKQNVERTQGFEAQRSNIAAAKALAEAVRSTLGPRGMDKMLVDSLGDVVITNDGATILKEMDIAHPAAKMIVEVAKTQDDEVGDGTTTAVVIAGELLKKAENLLDSNVHPTVIASGYKIAAEEADKILQNIATKVDIGDVELLLKVANTAMTGKGAEKAKDTLGKLAVDAVRGSRHRQHQGREEDRRQRRGLKAHQGYHRRQGTCPLRYARACKGRKDRTPRNSNGSQGDRDRRRNQDYRPRNAPALHRAGRGNAQEDG